MTPVLRRQLPAWSPLALDAVAAAARGALREPRGLRNAVATTLCERYGARDALLVGSGTTALRLALTAVRETIPDRPIALPAWGCYDLATAAAGAGATVVLYDVDADTLGPDHRSLARALEREPAAVVAVHLYGYPVDMDRLARQCREAGAIVVEDAAQAAGGRLGNTPLGSFGSLTVLSFGRGKGTTAGAGGALLARDEIGRRLLSRAASYVPPPARGAKIVAALAAQWALGRPDRYWLPAAIPFLRLGETVYHAPCAPTALTSAALRALPIALEASDVDVAIRRALAERLVSQARRRPGVGVIEPIPHASPGYLRLPLRLAVADTTSAVRQLARLGVAAGYPAPLVELPGFSARVVNPRAGFSGATRLARTLVTLPTHRHVGPAELAALEGWLSDA